MGTALPITSRREGHFTDGRVTSGRSWISRAAQQTLGADGRTMAGWARGRSVVGAKAKRARPSPLI